VASSFDGVLTCFTPLVAYLNLAVALFEHEQNRRSVVLTEGQLIRANAVAVVCEKCFELDKKMEQYRRIASSITDQLTIDRINKLIKDTAAEKAKLHPDQEQ
jgi:hypothetical protein